MKTIQISIDTDLLHQIDNDEETKKIGRSAFLGKVVKCYLEQKRRNSIAEKYRLGYSQGLASQDGLISREDEQVWPPT